MSDLPPIRARVVGVSFDNRDGTPRQPFVKLVKGGDALLLGDLPVSVLTLCDVANHHDEARIASNLDRLR